MRLSLLNCQSLENDEKLDDLACLEAYNDDIVRCPV